MSRDSNNNIKIFGVKNPPLFANTITDDLHPEPVPIQKLTVEDIRQSKDCPKMMRPRRYKYVILKISGELVISDQYSKLIPIFDKSQYQYSSLPIMPGKSLVEGEYCYWAIIEGGVVYFDKATKEPLWKRLVVKHPDLAQFSPVAFAGDFYVHKGRIIKDHPSGLYGIDNWTEHYKCSAEEQKKLVEHVFLNNGFDEAKGAFQDRAAAELGYKTRGAPVRLNRLSSSLEKSQASDELHWNKAEKLFDNGNSCRVLGVNCYIESAEDKPRVKKALFLLKNSQDPLISAQFRLLQQATKSGHLKIAFVHAPSGSTPFAEYGPHTDEIVISVGAWMDIKNLALSIQEEGIHYAAEIVFNNLGIPYDSEVLPSDNPFYDALRKDFKSHESISNSSEILKKIFPDKLGNYLKENYDAEAFSSIFDAYSNLKLREKVKECFPNTLSYIQSTLDKGLKYFEHKPISLDYKNKYPWNNVPQPQINPVIKETYLCFDMFSGVRIYAESLEVVMKITPSLLKMQTHKIPLLVKQFELLSIATASNKITLIFEAKISGMPSAEYKNGEIIVRAMPGDDVSIVLYEAITRYSEQYIHGLKSQNNYFSVQSQQDFIKINDQAGQELISLIYGSDFLSMKREEFEQLSMLKFLKCLVDPERAASVAKYFPNTVEALLDNTAQCFNKVKTNNFFINIGIRLNERWSTLAWLSEQLGYHTSKQSLEAELIEVYKGRKPLDNALSEKIANTLECEEETMFQAPKTHQLSENSKKIILQAQEKGEVILTVSEKSGIEKNRLHEAINLNKAILNYEKIKSLSQCLEIAESNFRQFAHVDVNPNSLLHEMPIETFRAFQRGIQQQIRVLYPAYDFQQSLEKFSRMPGITMDLAYKLTANLSKNHLEYQRLFSIYEADLFHALQVHHIDQLINFGRLPQVSNYAPWFVYAQLADENNLTPQEFQRLVPNDKQKELISKAMQAACFSGPFSTNTLYLLSVDMFEQLNVLFKIDVYKLSDRINLLLERPSEIRRHGLPKMLGGNGCVPTVELYQSSTPAQPKVGNVLPTTSGHLARLSRIHHLNRVPKALVNAHRLAATLKLLSNGKKLLHFVSSNSSIPGEFRKIIHLPDGGKIRFSKESVLLSPRQLKRSHPKTWIRKVVLESPSGKPLAKAQSYYRSNLGWSDWRVGNTGFKRAVPGVVHGVFFYLYVREAQLENPNGRYINDAIWNYGIDILCYSPLMLLGSFSTHFAITGSLPDATPLVQQDLAMILANPPSTLIDGIAHMGRVQALSDDMLFALIQKIAKPVMNVLHRLSSHLKEKRANMMRTPEEWMDVRVRQWMNDVRSHLANDRLSFVQLPAHLFTFPELVAMYQFSNGGTFSPYYNNETLNRYGLSPFNDVISLPPAPQIKSPLPITAASQPKMRSLSECQAVEAMTRGLPPVLFPTEPSIPELTFSDVIHHITHHEMELGDFGSISVDINADNWIEALIVHVVDRLVNNKLDSGHFNVHGDRYYYRIKVAGFLWMGCEITITNKELGISRSIKVKARDINKEKRINRQFYKAIEKVAHRSESSSPERSQQYHPTCYQISVEGCLSTSESQKIREINAELRELFADSSSIDLEKARHVKDLIAAFPDKKFSIEISEANSMIDTVIDQTVFWNDLQNAPFEELVSAFYANQSDIDRRSMVVQMIGQHFSKGAQNPTDEISSENNVEAVKKEAVKGLQAILQESKSDTTSYQASEVSLSNLTNFFHMSLQKNMEKDADGINTWIKEFNQFQIQGLSEGRLTDLLVKVRDRIRKWEKRKKDHKKKLKNSGFWDGVSYSNKAIGQIMGRWDNKITELKNFEANLVGATKDARFFRECQGLSFDDLLKKASEASTTNQENYIHGNLLINIHRMVGVESLMEAGKAAKQYLEQFPNYSEVEKYCIPVINAATSIVHLESRIYSGYQACWDGKRFDVEKAKRFIASHQSDQDTYVLKLCEHLREGITTTHRQEMQEAYTRCFSENGEGVMQFDMERGKQFLEKYRIDPAEKLLDQSANINDLKGKLQGSIQKNIQSAEYQDTLNEAFRACFNEEESSLEQLDVEKGLAFLKQYPEEDDINRLYRHMIKQGIAAKCTHAIRKKYQELGEEKGMDYSLDELTRLTQKSAQDRDEWDLAQLTEHGCLIGQGVVSRLAQGNIKSAKTLCNKLKLSIHDDNTAALDYEALINRIETMYNGTIPIDENMFFEYERVSNLREGEAPLSTIDKISLETCQQYFKNQIQIAFLSGDYKNLPEYFKRIIAIDLSQTIAMEAYHQELQIIQSHAEVLGNDTQGQFANCLARYSSLKEQQETIVKKIEEPGEEEGELPFNDYQENQASMKVQFYHGRYLASDMSQRGFHRHAAIMLEEWRKSHPDDVHENDIYRDNLRSYGQISDIVLQPAGKIFRDWLQDSPDFRGKPLVTGGLWALDFSTTAAPQIVTLGSQAAITKCLGQDMCVPEQFWSDFKTGLIKDLSTPRSLNGFLIYGGLLQKAIEILPLDYLEEKVSYHNLNRLKRSHSQLVWSSGLAIRSGMAYRSYLSLAGYHAAKGIAEYASSPLLISSLLNIGLDTAAAVNNKNNASLGQASEDESSYLRVANAGLYIDAVGWVFYASKAFGPIGFFGATALWGTAAFYLNTFGSYHADARNKALNAMVSNARYFEYQKKRFKYLDRVHYMLVIGKPSQAQLNCVKARELILLCKESNQYYFYSEKQGDYIDNLVPSKYEAQLKDGLCWDNVEVDVSTQELLLLKKTFVLSYLSSVVFDHYLNDYAPIIFQKDSLSSKQTSQVESGQSVIFIVDKNQKSELHIKGRKSGVLKLLVKMPCFPESSGDLPKTITARDAGFTKIWIFVARLLLKGYHQNTLNTIESYLIKHFGGKAYEKATGKEQANDARAFLLASQIRSFTDEKEYSKAIKCAGIIKNQNKSFIDKDFLIPADKAIQVILNYLYTFIESPKHLLDFRNAYEKYSEVFYTSMPNYLAKDDYWEKDILGAFRDIVKMALRSMIEKSIHCEDHTLKAQYLSEVRQHFNKLGNWKGLLEDQFKLLAACVSYVNEDHQSAWIFFEEIGDKEAAFLALFDQLGGGVPRGWYDLLIDSGADISNTVLNSIEDPAQLGQAKKECICALVDRKRFSEADQKLNDFGKFDRKNSAKAYLLYYQDKQNNIVKVLKLLLSEKQQNYGSRDWLLLFNVAKTFLESIKYYHSSKARYELEIYLYLICHVAIDHIESFGLEAKEKQHFSSEKTAIQLSIIELIKEQSDKELYDVLNQKDQMKKFVEAQHRTMRGEDRHTPLYLFKEKIHCIAYRFKAKKAMKYYIVEDVPSNGDCFFHCLNVSRKEAMLKLARHIWKEWSSESNDANTILMNLLCTDLDIQNKNKNAFCQIMLYIKQLSGRGVFMPHNQLGVSILDAIACIYKKNLCIYIVTDSGDLKRVSSHVNDSSYETIHILHTSANGFTTDCKKLNHYVKLVHLPSRVVELVETTSRDLRREPNLFNENAVNCGNAGLSATAGESHVVVESGVHLG